MYKQTISPLPESIRNVHSTDYYDYIERLKNMNNFFDVKDSNGLTPLFLCLQYSSTNKLLLVLFTYICTYKHINSTSFDDFNKNMQLVKDNFPKYYDKLVIQIKELISNEDLKKKLIL
jgi:hypothetical protein